MGKKGSDKQSIALLFWHSTDSGDSLERLLVLSKGLLIGVDQLSPRIAGVKNVNSMGSIGLHQSAGLCLQPEAAQENSQNLLSARTKVPCYVYQTLFFRTYTQRKKAVWLRETTVL